jgi:uncharacterized membrane protein YjgN (DUF898 family)
VGGHALDFHGKASRMLRGTLVVGVFLMLYSAAGRVSPWATLVATLAFLALWPLLFRSSMRFRLSQTSWRGLRFRFTGSTPGAYRALLGPLALILLPVTLAGFFVAVPGDAAAKVAQPPPAVGGVIGLCFLLFLLGLPYFLYLTKRYQHNHYAYGPLQTEFRTGAASFYPVFLKFFGLLLALGFVVAVTVFVSPKPSRAALPALLLALVPLFFLGLLLFNVVGKSYLQVRLQNLVWTRTGTHQFRFKSNLALGPFIGLQFKNYLLIALSAGLYWPFALVATRRAQLQATSLHTAIDLDTLAAMASRADADATGDAAAEVFDLGIGM